MTSLAELKGNYSNEELAQRKEAEKAMFEYADLTSEPPEWLPLGGKTEWERIVPLLKEDMPISELDYSLLTAYCCSFARIKTAENDIRKNGVVQTVILSNGVETRKPNPFVSIQSNAIKDMKSISTALGITLEARQRMAFNKAKQNEVVDPFKQLMGDV